MAPTSARPGFVGTDSFTYKANDSVGDSDTATVRIQVKDATKPTSTISDTTPTIKATVKDNFTNLQKANIKLYLNGESISSTKYSYSASTDLLTYNSPRLSKGKKNV